MKLEQLLQQIDYKCIQGSIDCDVPQLILDSRQADITYGALFFCIPGANFDGHDFAPAMAEKGATVFVVSRPIPGLPKEATVVLVEDTRYAMAHISAAWFGHPAKKLKVIGITGTKGKTTTTYLVKSILENAGRKVGLVGTIETIIGQKHIPAKNTTPESYLLQQTFAEMVEAGLDTVVMEVSSQALMQHRTQGFVFDFGIFTNLSADHIGPNEHGSFEEYAACKALLFKQCKVGIVNGDDSNVELITRAHTCKLETYGLGHHNDLQAKDLTLDKDPGALGISFRVDGLTQMDVTVPTPGRFSVYNALCAVAICRHFDVPKDKVRSSLAKAKVKGRIEKVDISDKFTLLIDYAHNAMSLQSLLETLKEYQPGRLVCLFGCGGNRAKSRRYEMGEVSGNLADLTVITSDNPRFEKPLDIIEDIKVGIQKTDGKYMEIPDRRQAIGYVIENAREGDLIVLAGKGHEDYQEIEGVKYPMDERIIIQELLDGGLHHI